MPGMEKVGGKRQREEECGSGAVFIEREKRSVTELNLSDVTGSLDSPSVDGAPAASKEVMPIEEKERRITDAFRTVLESLDEDPNREGLRKTPARYARALMDFTEGYRRNLKDVVGDAEFSESHDEIVFLANVEVFSLCEHHMVPFFGKCHIAYVPNGKVIGLSKLARIAELFSKRLQIQERLTRQIAEAIEESIDPAGVAVFVEASHMCMVMRGVQQTSARTTTLSTLGCFKTEPERRREFLDLVQNSKR